MTARSLSARLGRIERHYREIALLQQPSIDRSNNILDAIASPALFGRWFRDPSTWIAWRSFLAALFALPLDAEGLALFERCTGREAPRPGGYVEAWLTCGRRAGKSFILALIAVYLACFRDWLPYLAPGEIGTIKIVACDRRQARVIHRYCRALLTGVPALATLVKRESDEEIILGNGIAIEIQTANFRSIRGFTVVGALCDELAFWRNEETSANPDEEILAALRPAMATVPGAILLCASSPYARRGELYAAFRRHYGKDSPVLFWKAATVTMNPTVPQRVIDEAYERDPAWAAAEYGAEFRTDVEALVAREAVDAVVAPDRLELPPVSTAIYRAFVDPSGGSGDSMTLAIAHRDDARNKIMVDVIRERRPPFSPDDVVAEFAEVLKPYRVMGVKGDRYAAEWPRERFRGHGINYEPSEKTKSDLYRDLLPMINSRQVELPDHPRLIAQLVGLERRTARGGRDSIDHAPGAHDDVANAVAGALVAVGSQSFLASGATARPVRRVNASAFLYAQERALRRGHWLLYR